MDKALPGAIPKGGWLNVRTTTSYLKPGPHEDDHSQFPEPAVGQQPSEISMPYVPDDPATSDASWEPYPDDPNGEWTLARAYSDPSMRPAYHGARTDVITYDAHDDMRGQDTDDLGFQNRHTSGTTSQRFQLPTEHDGWDASPNGRYGWSPVDEHARGPIAITEAVRNPPNNVLASGSAGTYTAPGPPDVKTKDRPAQSHNYVPDFEGGWA